MRVRFRTVRTAVARSIEERLPDVTEEQRLLGEQLRNLNDVPRLTVRVDTGPQLRFSTLPSRWRRRKQEYPAA